MAPLTLDAVEGMICTKNISIACADMASALDRLKDVIQNLFEIQSAVHGYLGPETQQELIRKVYLSSSSPSYQTLLTNDILSQNLQ